MDKTKLTTSPVYKGEKKDLWDIARELAQDKRVQRLIIMFAESQINGIVNDFMGKTIELNRKYFNAKKLNKKLKIKVE